MNAKVDPSTLETSALIALYDARAPKPASVVLPGADSYAVIGAVEALSEDLDIHLERRGDSVAWSDEPDWTRDGSEVDEREDAEELPLDPDSLPSREALDNDPVLRAHHLARIEADFPELHRRIQEEDYPLSVAVGVSLGVSWAEQTRRARAARLRAEREASLAAPAQRAPRAPGAPQAGAKPGPAATYPDSAVIRVLKPVEAREGTARAVRYGQVRDGRTVGEFLDAVHAALGGEGKRAKHMSDLIKLSAAGKIRVDA